MNILITGANGQLGSEFNQIKGEYEGFDFFFTGSIELDICNLKAVENFVAKNNIDIIVNCAAYTNVDKAESEENLSKKVNAEGVWNLVKAINKVGGKIIQISTDYVFNGNQFLPYSEIDKTSPIGIYGKSKYQGEKAILNSDVNGIVIRTSWLYSSFGNNFVKTMLRLGNEKEEIGVIFDQIGSPTYAKDLAKVCLEILNENKILNTKGKVYHFSNEGVASWYDFAESIMEFGGRKCKIKPIETTEYPTPAKRPFFTVLNKKKIKTDFNIEIPYWRVSLKKCVEILEN